MKIYVVTCRDHEEHHNEFCHTDFDLVLTKMMGLKNNKYMYDNLLSLECWENGEQLFDYGLLARDLINIKNNYTKQELINDIECHIVSFSNKSYIIV